MKSLVFGGMLLIVSSVGVTSPALASDQLIEALECRAGKSTIAILKQSGIILDGERHVLASPVLVYGVSVRAVSVISDHDGIMLYIEIPMRKKKEIAQTAQLRHIADEEGASYTRTLKLGATMTIDDISDEGDVAMFECRIDADEKSGS